MNFDLLIKFIPYVFPGICCCMFLMAFILTDRTFSKIILFSFGASVVCGLLLVLGDALDFYLELEKKRADVRQLVGSLNYIWRVACVGYMVRISQRKMKQHVFIIDIYILINAIFSIINIWTGWIFKINPDHSFSFGKLINLPYFVIGFFILFFLYSILKYLRTNTAESIALGIALSTCFVANLIEIFYPVKIVLGQAFCISTVLYYLCLTNQLYKRDALTDLFNRRCFFRNTDRLKNSTFGVIMLDLNDLKKLNDEEGHKAGDEALITCAENMLKVFKKFGILYRLGGDEFAIIINNKHIKKIEALLDNFEMNMASTKYVMAYGYAVYKPNDDIEAVLDKADANMYENKKLVKGCAPR